MRVLNNSTNEIIYNGTQENFSYDAKPFTKYDFELMAFKDLNKTYIIDRQVISVLTHSESMKCKEFTVKNFKIYFLFNFRTCF